MIYGIGTDIISIPRMDSLLTRYADKLSGRLLSPGERDECATSASPAAFVAKRFAAKEALAKAVGTGIRAPLFFSAVSVTHTALGQPGFAYDAALAAWMAQRGIGAAHLSLSDEAAYAVAFVVLERA